MSLYICVDDDGNPLDAAAALRDVVQRAVTDVAAETRYDEALEKFTEEVRDGDREPPFIYPHGVSIDSAAGVEKSKRTDKDKCQ